MVIKQKSAYNLHSSCWHFQTHLTTEVSMGAFEAAMDVYISYKFREQNQIFLQLLRLYTVYSRHQSALGIIYIRLLKGSTFVLRYYSRGATLPCWAGYTLSFATHI